MRSVEAMPSVSAMMPVSVIEPITIEVPSSRMELVPYLQELGLPDIPFFSVGVLHESGFSPSILHTGVHELGHALVAKDFGILPISISVEAQGDSLGRTIFTPGMNLDIFQVIAAGGWAMDHYGAPSGFGHDFFQIGYIDYLLDQKFGQSLEWAKLKAKAKVSPYSRDEIMVMAKILAQKQEVSGSMLPEMINRARLEARLAADNKLHLLEDVISGKKEEGVKAARLQRDYEMIDYLENGMYRYTSVRNDEVVLTLTICPRCGGKDGHCPGCGTQEQLRKMLPENGPAVMIGRRGDIYSIEV